MDLLITGGKVATPQGVVESADIAIRGEKIEAVGRGLAEAFPGTPTLDASGHLVMPGVIDVHVHLELPFCGTVSADDYRTGTRAGARGGVTSVIDFAIPPRHADGSTASLSEAVDTWMAKAQGKALIDYTFHVCVTRYHQHRQEMAAMVKRGFPTFKEFMIYEAEGWQSDDGAMFGTLEECRRLGAMLLVHAESSRLIDELQRRHASPDEKQRLGARLHALTRPNVNEEEAIGRACLWSRATGGKLYIVHLSSGEGAEVVWRHQHDGTPVIAETCPQYLVLDESMFERPDGHLYACCPQIKTPEDQVALWDALAEGTLSVVSTDTCTFTRQQKAMWQGDYTRIPMGLPGLETLLPLVYTEGVLAGRISLERAIEVLCEQPARIMGLWGRKGAIAPGFDADIAIIHPTHRMVVNPETMETNCDWSPYEGRHLAGFARTTISRGTVIVDNYKVRDGLEGRGQWLHRDPLSD